MLCVTAIDEAYLPALRALANSFRRNAGPNHSLYAFVHGGRDLVYEVDHILAGIGHARPAPNWWKTNQRIPSSTHWPNVSLAMYSRLLAPNVYYMEDRLLWLDADCLVMRSLDDLEHFPMEHAVAGRHIGSDVNRHVGELDTAAGRYPDLVGVAAMGTGVMLIDVDKWLVQRLMERCADVMQTEKRDMPFVVQSVLNLVLMGEFDKLPLDWNRSPAKDGEVWSTMRRTRIYHYTAFNPWEENERLRDSDRHQDAIWLWRQYG